MIDLNNGKGGHQRKRGKMYAEGVQGQVQGSAGFATQQKSSCWGPGMPRGTVPSERTHWSGAVM